MVSPNHTSRQIHPPQEELQLVASKVDRKDGTKAKGSAAADWLASDERNSIPIFFWVAIWKVTRRPWLGYQGDEMANQEYMLCNIESSAETVVLIYRTIFALPARLKVRINPFTVAFVLSRDDVEGCLFVSVYFYRFPRRFLFLRRIGTIPGIETKRIRARQPSNYQLVHDGVTTATK